MNRHRRLAARLAVLHVSALGPSLLLLTSCAPRLALGPSPTSTTLQATAAIESDPEVAGALAALTPAQRDLAMRVLQKVALHEAPIVAAQVKEGRGLDAIVADIVGSEAAARGGVREQPHVVAAPHGEAAAPDAAQPAEGGDPDSAPPPAPPPAIYKKIDAPAWSPVAGPKYARVTLIVFSEFQCPFCARVEPTLAQVKSKYGESVRVVWRNMPLPFHNHAMFAARAAMAAEAQGRFWPYHDKLFANQQSLDEESLRRYAAELGLDMKRFEADYTSPKIREQIDADIKVARAHDANGTPTSFVNGRVLVGAQPLAAFSAAIDDELARADKLLARGVKLPDLYPTILREMSETPTAARDGDDEPEQHAEVKIPGDAPTVGARSAPVTLVEFSDFQCPFCGRAAATVSTLHKKYKGSLRVVYMHQPLAFHQFAQVAAEASMAAHAQGKFWPFHDKLFENQRSLERADLERYAAEVHLDLPRFRKALDEHVFAARVRADSEEGSRVKADGTPTFFINGVRLSGAQPQDRFEALIDKALAARGKQGTGRVKARK